MECEVCAEPTKEEYSDRPEGEDYFVWVRNDPEFPDDGLGIQKFRFCSVECLLAFAPPPEATA